MNKNIHILFLVSFILLSSVSNAQFERKISKYNPFKKKYDFKEKTIKLKKIHYDKYFSFTTYDSLDNRIIIYGSFYNYLGLIQKKYRVYFRYDKRENISENPNTKILLKYKDTLLIASQNQDTVNLDFIKSFIAHYNELNKTDNYDPISWITDNYLHKLLIKRKISIYDELNNTHVNKVIKINVYRNMIYQYWYGEEFYLCNPKRLFFVHIDNGRNVHIFE